MGPESLEERCKKAVIRASDDLRDIRYMLSHYIDTRKYGKPGDYNDEQHYL